MTIRFIHVRYIVLQEKENYYDALRRVGEL